MAVSLINKVLQDLEARQETAPRSAAPVYRDLRPVRLEQKRGAWRLLAAVAAVATVAVAAYFSIERAGIAPAPSVARVEPPAQAPAAGPSVHIPAAAPEAKPLPEVQEESKPLPVPASEPVVAVAAAPPPETPSVAVVAPTRPIQPSPNAAPLAIVKGNELKPAPSHKGERKAAEAKTTTPRNEPVVTASPESAGLVDKRTRPLTPDEKAEAGYRQAVRLLDQGRPEEALRRLRESLGEQPKHVKARELAAGIALQTGHAREAQILLEEGLRELPNQYLFARLLARVYVDRGAEAKALAVMESAAPAGSDDAEFSSLLGVLYQRAGRHTDAVQAYERALALRPSDARTWLGFAISLEAIEQLSAAKNAYQRATQSGLDAALARYAEQRLAALRDR